MENKRDMLKRTLLPYASDINGLGGNSGEDPKRMNVIMKVNNEQILSLLSGYASRKVSIRAVVKNGRIVGLRKVLISPSPSSDVKDKKVEIVRCNTIKESIGSLYHDIEGDGKYAVNMGPLDYRMNMINYKPILNEEDVKSIRSFKERVELIKAVTMQASKDESKCTRDGIRYSLEELKKDGYYRGDFANLCDLTPEGKSGESIIDWKWIKFIKGFDTREWMKRLYIEGYRPNDAYTMLYTGRVDRELIKDKSNDEDIAVYSDSGDSSSVEEREGRSEKSSMSSIGTTFSRDSRSRSRDTTPEKEKLKEVKEAKEAKEAKEISEPKVTVKKRSFKEYQMSKASASVSASPAPVIMITEPSVPFKKVKRVADEEMVGEYENKYSKYRKLYNRLREWEVKGVEERQVNECISRLLRLHNELVEMERIIRGGSSHDNK